MPQSTDVNLPRSHKAVYPCRCVVCQREQPDSHVRLFTGTIGWWSVLAWWWKKPFVTRAPACWKCGWLLHLLRLMNLLVVCVVAYIVIFYVYPHVEPRVPLALRRWGAVGLTLVFLLPYFAYTAYRAPPLDVTAYANSVDYEFASADYAVDFAVLNHDADWVKVNGQLLECSIG